MADKNVDNYIVNCEKEILTTVFNDPITVEEAVVQLSLKDFIDEKNALIFGAIYEIYSGHLKTVNKNTVIDYITNNPK
ncbi:MAG: hypothetical protein MJ223_04180 [Mycoplasmoidaceae bacterium]|nr:hypothetical protein [Mycoplasmoidaceae bacterium]